MGGSKDVNYEKYVFNFKFIRVMENRLDEMMKKFSIVLIDNLYL